LARHARPAVELAAKVAGLVHLRRPFADANRKHRFHTGFLRAAQHGLAVAMVPMTVQVRV
jgi:citrate lyase beta subunit